MMAKPRTVTVKIAVAVLPSGQWVARAHGDEVYSYYSDLVGSQLDSGLSGAAIHWITAEVPIPEPREISGTVAEQ